MVVTPLPITPETVVLRLFPPTVNGNVWWDTYRDPVTNVVLLDKVTGTHLAQWNL